VLDTADIDDALSQAAARVWRAGPRFDPAKGTLRAWYYVIARNCALRIVQAKANRPLHLVEDLDAVVPAPLPQAAESVANPKRQRFAQDLHRCIAQLPRLQRLVISADLAAGGVADTEHLVRDLDTTANAVYVSRARARKTLREALTRLGHQMASREAATEGEVTA